MGEIIGLTAMILFILLIVFLIVAHKSNMSELENENKELKEKLRYYKTKSDFLNKVIVKYQEENKELKEKLRYYKTKSDFLNKVIVKYQEENKELKKKLEEADKYVVLQKIRNGEF